MTSQGRKVSPRKCCVVALWAIGITFVLYGFCSMLFVDDAAIAAATDPAIIALAGKLEAACNILYGICWAGAGFLALLFFASKADNREGCQ